MKTIPLTQGMVALVDDADYAALAEHKWCAARTSRGDKFYAVRAAARDENGRQRMIYMHREILGLASGEFGDHRDNDGLNNQRNNLRRATRAQNAINCALPTRSATGFKGVSSVVGKYQATIVVDGVNRYLGRFKSPENAAIAYNLAALENFGPFARLNTAEPGLTIPA